MKKEIIRKAAQQAYPPFGYDEEAYCDLPQDISQPAFIKGAEWALSQISTKDRIMSETSDETKQKARDYGNNVVNEWLEKNPNPEIDEQLAKEFKQIEDEEDAEAEYKRQALEWYETMKFQSRFPADKQSFIEGAKWRAKRMYTEKEAKELAGIVSAELGIYIAKCFVNKTMDPQTGKKFEELYEKHRKK